MKINKNVQQKLVMVVMTIILMFAPVVVLANPNPIGNLETWTQGQLQAGVRIALMLGVIGLALTKKITNLVQWGFILILAAVAVWNPNLILDFLRGIGNLILGN